MIEIDNTLLLINFTYLACVCLNSLILVLRISFFYELSFLKNVKFMKLNFDVLVESPLGYQVVCNQIYDCPFLIQNLVFLTDFIEVPFKDFDIIIEMD